MVISEATEGLLEEGALHIDVLFPPFATPSSVASKPTLCKSSMNPERLLLRMNFT